MPRTFYTKPKSAYEFEEVIPLPQLSADEELMKSLCSSTLLTGEAWARTGSAVLAMSLVEEDRLFQTA